jgi:hypothetical protein
VRVIGGVGQREDESRRLAHGEAREGFGIDDPGDAARADQFLHDGDGLSHRLCLEAA